MNTKFLHLRYPTETFQYTSRGGVTLAYQINGDKLLVGVALCSRNDAYNKRLGRTISQGRMVNAPWIFTLDKNLDRKDIIMDMTDLFCDDDGWLVEWKVSQYMRDLRKDKRIDAERP